MKVVIFGFDEFGEQVAALLNKNDVLVVTIDEDESEKAKDKLYETVQLKEISDEELKVIEDRELALAFFKEEDKNLFLCLSIKDLFPHMKLIAKVTKKDNEFKYKLAGVDKIINPYQVTTNRIMTILKKPLTLKIIEQIIFEDNDLSFAEIEIPEESFLEHTFIKSVLGEISKNYNLIIIGIVDKELNKDVQFITKGYNHKIDAGDVLVVVGDKYDIERFKDDLKMLKVKNG